MMSDSPFRVERTDDGMRFTFDVTARTGERQMLAGTAEHRLVSVETDLSITAPGADPETVGALVDQAERMCFVPDALQRPHDLERRSSLNGRPLP